MEAKLQDMKSILRKVVVQGITATATSCLEQIPFFLVFCGERVYWGSARAVLPLWDSCMALLAGAHNLALLEQLFFTHSVLWWPHSSSFSVSLFIFNLLQCLTKIDFHL